ncbi:aminoacyl-tRNA hydrolase [Asticcacaulis sp. AND118]|uniref:aminoacyl-tRNA hydrolase n=1 Tax=Asticcacaulis sp. AND118 TaxID=2840468 RepID=UPI001CFFBD8C|nr:aminoacyl-tRNA hydrolase [Asticcacaulis sp. AND118]UDF02639.1 aminoacyl-tRNA hydrolase [Asticcacaulis sp. AND118]
MFLVVGLGNPGPQYAKNRHNIGFMFIDRLIDGAGFGPVRKKFQSEVSEGTIDTPKGPAKILAMKPQTFMNLSGNAVLEAAAFYKVKPDHILVFHDELDLAPGRFRLKMGGGHAGHNGLRSIMGHLGPNFVRGRMGIGHPGQKELVHSWVLSDFYKAEDWVERLCDACVKALPLALMGESEKYMTEVMRLSPAPKFDPKKVSQ